MPKARGQRPPNDRLRELIAASGMSYEGLARAVVAVAAENGDMLRTNKSAVAHWVAGAVPAEQTIRYLAEALSRLARRPVLPAELGYAIDAGPVLPGVQPIETATLLGRADLEHRETLAAAVYTASGVRMPIHFDHDPVARLLRASTGSSRVGAQEITVVRQTTTAFAAADEVLGGGHGLSTVAAYLADTAAPMLAGRFANEAARRDTFGAVAELAWKWAGNTTTSVTRARRSATTCSASSWLWKLILALTPRG